MSSANSLVVALLLLTGVGCTPTRFNVRPERDDPAAASATASRATVLCAHKRGEAHLPPHAFTSDGCSVWPDGSWTDCCMEHDMAYWCGGNAEDREHADAALRACVARHGATCLAPMMYVGVRVGGIPWQPFPWRWAYGWSGVHGYDDPARSTTAP